MQNKEKKGDQNMAKLKAVRNRNIINRMETLGLTQKALAERAGIHPDTVRDVIRNKWDYQAREETVWSLAYALRETPENLGLKHFLKK